ncbi:MAG: hydroxyacid dehydrogenase [Betaproteobacteria bacterium]|nr:hydroxyacid dehydrogenase [Betaproteobacteria bacterium]
MSIVFHFDGTQTLAQRVGEQGVTLCAENDEISFARLAPNMEVLWHVLKPVTAEVIAWAPKLALIQKIGVGVNTIDIESAKRRGIAVCNLPGTNSRAVAEMALLLMLACLRQLRAADSLVRTKGWYQALKMQDQLGEIAGRTVGLLGYGAVPKILHGILDAMGAKVLYWSRSIKNASLEELIAQADIVSLHLPLSPATANFLDPRTMKRGSIMVNTARGGLVDEAALVEALETGHIAAAGLDVFATEPLPADHPLLARPNVICAPHIAWLTGETLDRSIAAALENVRRLHAGEALLNRVA